MPGLSSTLSLAKTAIYAQQNGINVTGNNIANVNNPNYSVQRADHVNRKPSDHGGFLFGTGVNMDQIRQNVDALLEARLTGEMSEHASLKEQESYVRVLEGFFDETSKTSLTTVLNEFWNDWHDLADNPQGSSERVAIYESGNKLANRFESVVLDMDKLLIDVSSDIRGAVQQVNDLSDRIAELNNEVLSGEIHRTANDQRDQRNALVKELGTLIDISIIEQPSGSLIINAANGFTLVNGDDSYGLKVSDDEVLWEGSSGAGVPITDKISAGKIGGLLEIRDVVIPKFSTEVNALAREMIWAINYQHSQGAGLAYHSEPVTGDYRTDESGWLTSFEFGNKIDFSKDFSMWVEDKTDPTAEYRKIMMDMGVSEARISNWQGTAPGGVQSIYKLTVMDSALLGDMEVFESDGDGLAVPQGSGSTSGVATALDNAIADQTISIYNGPSGTSVIEVADAGKDAKRSAASIADALNEVEGVTASASPTSATYELIDNGGIQDGDEVRYAIYVDGVVQAQSFIRDASAGTLAEQYEASLLAGIEAVNKVNEDEDLYLDGLTVHSTAGRTLGLQDFEVQDNTGIRLNGFTNFDSGDTVTFKVESMAGAAVNTTTAVSIDLSGVDVSDEGQMAEAFYDALSSTLDPDLFTVDHDPTSNSVVVKTSDGTGIQLLNGSGDTGNNAQMNVSPLNGGTNVTAPGPLLFDGGVGSVRHDANVSDVDQMRFSGQGRFLDISETSAVGGNKNAVITGTVSIVVEEGMEIQTSVAGVGSGGLFSSITATKGSSILTLGGEGGFSGFSTAGGETISFNLDGTNIIFDTTAGAGTSDLELAQLFKDEIEADLAAAGKDGDYTVVMTASSVSVIKKKGLEKPIKIENFSDSLGNNATLKVRTGTGSGTNQPENDLLEADPAKSYRNSTTSTLYNDEGVIQWERLDSNGVGTGAMGLVRVEDQGQVSILEGGSPTLTFDISKGSLVAGNVMTINTNTQGQPDPLDFKILGEANSINDLYQFKVVSGGKVGHLPAEGEPPLVIEWSNSVTKGSFTIEGHDPPYTPLAPVEVSVDGMVFKFSDGTLFNGDVFTVSTGDTGLPQYRTVDGNPTGVTESDWHWTLDSFTEEFNRQGAGLKASATYKNELQFEASQTCYTIQDTEYSGTNGFSEDNVNITVTDWSGINFAASDLKFERSGNGVWGVHNDPTGGVLQLLPPGGDDDGFGVDVTGDGFADLKIEFKERVGGNGYVQFDLGKRNTEEIGFAFSDDASSDSGLAAAAGVNTFFKGRDAMTMEMNTDLKDTRLIAAAKVDADTGLISKGDNSNANAMADVQFQDKTMTIWTYERGKEAVSKSTTATLDDYFNTIVSSLGIRSRNIKSSKSFADTMVNNITAQRDAISAVSLDEEMIQLIRYQHAFSAASKLVTVSDEMLNTLISMR